MIGRNFNPDSMSLNCLNPKLSITCLSMMSAMVGVGWEGDGWRAKLPRTQPESSFPHPPGRNRGSDPLVGDTLLPPSALNLPALSALPSTLPRSKGPSCIRDGKAQASPCSPPPPPPAGLLPPSLLLSQSHLASGSSARDGNQWERRRWAADTGSVEGASTAHSGWGRES